MPRTAGGLYRLPSLRAYLVFDQDRPWAVAYCRTAEGFEERVWDGSGEVPVPWLDVTLRSEELYGPR